MKRQNGIKLDKTDNHLIEELHLISGENLETVHRVMRAFVIAFTMQYKEGEPIRVPYFGDFYVKYDRNEETYELDFEPHQVLKRLVKQIHDEEVSANHTQNDAYRLLMSEIKESLKEIVSVD